MKRIIAILATALAPLCANGSTFFLTGNELLSKCNSTEMHLRTDCIGYVTGVFDAFSSITICAPNGVTRGQVRDVVVQYLNMIPSERHKAADLLVGAVLAATWPCQRNQPQQPSRAL